MLADVKRPIFVASLLLCLACERPASAPASQASTPTPTPAASPDPAPQTAPAPTPVAKPPVAARPKAAELHYVERILGDAEPEDTLPMIVAIHGLGDDPDHFAHLFDAFPGTARLILPQGVDPTEQGGWSWFPIRARSQDVEGLATGIEASADKLAAMIAALEKTRPTAGAPIVTGFSQGGMLSFTLAVKHPEAVGFAVPVGGWLPPPLWPEAGPTNAHPRIVALHGTADNAVHFEPTKTCVDALTDKGYTVELKAYEGVRHAIPPQVRTDLYDLLADAVKQAGAKR